MKDLLGMVHAPLGRRQNISSNGLGKLFSPGLTGDVAKIDVQIREGRFQRSLALLTGLSSLLAGLEVAYEHYKGSYGQRVMYTPVILSGSLAVPVYGAFSTDGRRERCCVLWHSRRF